MVKTHPNSKFVLKDLDGIRNSSDIILQIDKTESTFSESNKTVYLCEVVPAAFYNHTSQTVERLTEELVRVNTDNRSLRNRIRRMERAFAKIELAGGTE